MTAALIGAPPALAGTTDYSLAAIAQTGVTIKQAETINDAGDVVGEATFPDSNSTPCAFLWHKALVSELPAGFAYGTGAVSCDGAAGGTPTEAWDLNDSDLIAGDASATYGNTTNSPPVPSPAEEGASWQATTGQPTTGPTFLGSACVETGNGEPAGSQALAVNASGTFAGEATTSCNTINTVTSAWLGSPSNIIATGTPVTGGKGDAYAMAVNSLGEAVVYYDGAGTGHGAPSASFYANNSLSTLPVTPFLIVNSSSARGGPDSLNDDGVVVGSTSAHAPGFSQNAGSAVTLTPADGDTEGIAEGVNDSGDVVGASAAGSGNQVTTVATVWPAAAPPATPATEPTGVDLNTLIPANSGITLTSAIAINASGQILAVGTPTGGGTEWVVLSPLIVTSTADLPESNSAAPGVCDDGAGVCTLRAAIQVANAASNAETIAFNVPGVTGIPKISIASPLPAITNPGTKIDGTTQPGTKAGAPGVQVDGADAGAGANGIAVAASNVTLTGLDLTGFGGDAIDVQAAGAGANVTDSWIGVTPGGSLAGNHVGIAVNASSVTIGSAQSGLGDVISGNGAVSAFQSAESSLSQNAPSAAASALSAAGGGVVANPSGAISNLQIAGDWFGAKPDGGDAGGYSNAVGIALQGQISDVTIGGSTNGAGDDLADDAIGIAALGSSVTGVAVERDDIGPLPGGSTSGDTGNGIGLYAGQGVSDLTVGATGAGNTFQDDGAGAVLAGLAAASVTANQFGADEAVPGDARTDLVGLALLDCTNSTVGSGNILTGDELALLVAGTKSAGNTITGNTIGRSTNLGKSATQLSDSVMGSVFGVLLAGGSGNTVTGNKIQYAGLGIGIAKSNANSITSNTVIGNFDGVWAIAGSSNAIGSPGAGNTIQDNDVGVLVLDENLPSKEEGLTGLPSSSFADQSERDQALDVTTDADALDFASAVSSAPVGQTSVNVPTAADTGNRVQGNTIGGSGQGNNVGVLLGGAVTGTSVGGQATGEANTISHGHEAGVWMLGWPGSEPSAAILGNSIFDNYDGSISGDVPGLGIDLAGIDQNGNPGPANSFGVNAPNHTVQPDPNEPDGDQNYPLLTAATPSGGNVQVAGSLTSAPKQTYLVQLFANTACSASGNGEGQQLVGAQAVTTGANGVGAISAIVPVSLAGAKVITATATSESGGSPVATSEFSPCQTIGGGPSYSGASPTGGTSTVSGGTATATVSCPTGTPGGCSGTATLTGTTTNAADLAAGANAKHKRKRVTLILGKATFKIAAGRSAKVRIRLSRAALKLLEKKDKLRATLIVTSHDGAGGKRTRTASVTLRLAGKRKRRS